jgi:hypothetical protein
MLHLMISNSLLVTRRRRLARSSSLWLLSGGLGRWLSWWPHEPLLLVRELRVGRAIYRAVSRLSCCLDVIVCDVSPLGVVELDVRGVWSDGDDVPGVQEAGEEAEAC